MTGADRSNLRALAGLGMLSGAIAWGLTMLASKGMYLAHLRGTTIEVSALSVLPGLVFGLIIGLLWYRRAIVSLASTLKYALASMVAYFLAFHVAINLFGRLTDFATENLALIVSGMIAGLAGSFLLGIATRRLLPDRHASIGGLPVLAGSVAGALLPLINVFNDWNGGFLLFLAAWQGAYAAALAPTLHRRAAAMPGALGIR